jgi:malonyl-CoA/methylmalonyl-CoA synthetase
MNMLSPIQRVSLFSDKIAITDTSCQYTYQTLLDNSKKIAQNLLYQTSKEDLESSCIAFMAVQNASYTMMQWGIWQAGGIAVPISITHPLPEIAYILEDTKADFLICTKEWVDILRPLQSEMTFEILIIENILNTCNDFKIQLPIFESQRDAMIIYTSGTTSRPKGVVTSHSNIESQIKTLVEAWDWQSSDVILHVLPLHHIHGVINALACALWIGAEVVILPKFDAKAVWDYWAEKAFTVFMAVPTIYHKLITEWDKMDNEMKQKYRIAFDNMRLMVSGSAALPMSILEKWKEISGHILLERYGMTEIGMAISNPFKGIRKAGHVGKALPDVEVELVDENHQVVTTVNESGEIRVKSPSVFKAYWQKPEATSQAFYEGWFYTGDIAQRDEEGYYRILGRSSLDIIKTGGYKVSALEIEDILLQHALILECAVVGIPDITWGESVAVALVFEGETELDLKELRIWAKEKLAHYKIPTQIKKVEMLPRNAMGKVIKNQVKELFLTKK